MPCGVIHFFLSGYLTELKDFAPIGTKILTKYSLYSNKILTSLSYKKLSNKSLAFKETMYNLFLIVGSVFIVVTLILLRIRYFPPSKFSYILTSI
jgi:hypothetical protein